MQLQPRKGLAFLLSALPCTVVFHSKCRLQGWMLTCWAQAWGAFETVHLRSPQVNMWLLLVAPLLLPYPCVACLNKMCFPPWHDPFLSRHQTLASLAEILCFPALAFQVLCRVTTVSFNFKDNSKLGILDTETSTHSNLQARSSTWCIWTPPASSRSST